MIHVPNIIFSKSTELSSLTLYDYTFVIHVPNIIFSQRTELFSLTLYDHTFVIHVPNIIFSQRTELSSLTLYDYTFVIHVPNIIFSQRTELSSLTLLSQRTEQDCNCPVQCRVPDIRWLSLYHVPNTSYGLLITLACSSKFPVEK